MLNVHLMTRKDSGEIERWEGANIGKGSANCYVEEGGEEQEGEAS